MDLKNIHFKSFIYPSNWFKIIFKSCSLLFLLCLFIGCTSSAYNKDNTPISIVNPSLCVSVPSQYTIHQTAPHQMVFAIFPNQMEIFITDEDTLDDDFDNDYEGQLSNESIQGNFHNALVKKTIPTSNFIQSKFSIPFFILYHSWKSFLA